MHRPACLVLGIVSTLASTLVIEVTARGDDATFQFEDVSALRGVLSYGMANGKGAAVAAADFDDDGDVDLFVPNAEGIPDQLYRNDGFGHFDEIAAIVGLASVTRSRSALWFDYDGDHRLDLFVAGDCWNAAQDCPDTSTLRLYRQMEDGRFENTTAEAEIPDDAVTSTTPHRGGICAGDINGDGYLDLFFGLWFGPPRLLLNDGDGTFTEITDEAGVNVFGHHWQPMMHDFNGDGDLDIYHPIDFNINHLWINQGDATFVDRSGDAGVDNAWNDMGMTLGDYDNDGDMDMYVTNIKNSARHNVLYRNDSVGEVLLFTEVSESLGVDDGGWGWGTTFFDADNDGDLDLAATNGWFSGPSNDDPSKFFLNNGGGTPFSNVSDSVGFNDTYWGSAVIAVDYDRDGDLDLVQTCNGNGTQPHLVRILENGPVIDRPQGNWLNVKPRMDGPNHRAIGAVVRVKAAGVDMMRLISAGTSCWGQEPAEAFFGLGGFPVAQELVIEWPDGRRTEMQNVPANQEITVSPPAALAFADMTAAIGGGLPATLTESVAWGDYDNDGDEDLYLTSDGANTLFRNDGNDVFTDVTAVAGVGNTLFSVGTAFGDLENDGDLDLYVVNFGTGPDVLYRNNGPVGPGGAYVFSDISADAGITIERSSRGMAYLDYNRDGLLDIYVNSIGNDILYHNLGNLRFVNIADELGTNPSGQGVGVIGTDVNNDGWIDIYNGNRSNDLSNLFINDHGTFDDIAAEAGIDAFGLGMGILSFDYDNDLDMDLYWTTWPGSGKTPVPNHLYQNQGDGTFYVDVAFETGTQDPDGWGISCNAGDIDNDGWQDFFVTNGFSADSTKNVLFRNLGGTTGFEDVTSLLTGSADWDGRGVAFADYDGDGDLDLVLTGAINDVTRLWRNDSVTGHHWLTVKLVGETSNRSAIGARVEVTTTDGTRTVQEVSGGAGRGSCNSLPVEFGLGDADAIDTIFIRWPSGLPQLVTTEVIDTTITITEITPGDVNADEVVDFADIVALLTAWGPCPPAPDYCLADFNSDGVVDFADVLVILANWGS